MTTHQFSVEHAQKYGLRESILIANFQFWVSHNHANGTHAYDGRTWTYNSVRAFEDLFPYLTNKQIRTSLDALVTLNVLVRGNYNEKPADRTCWFAFTDEFLAENPLPSRANGHPKKEKPLPSRANGVPCGANASALEGKSLIEQIVNTDRGSAAAPWSLPKSLFQDFLKVRDAKRAGPLTETAKDAMKLEIEKAGITLKEAVTACCQYSWPTFTAIYYAERTGKALPGAATPAAPAKGKALPHEANYVPPISPIWHQSVSGVTAKAAELGLKPQDMVMESPPVFKARVMAAFNRIAS